MSGMGVDGGGGLGDGAGTAVAGVPALVGIGGVVWEPPAGRLHCDATALAVLGMTREECERHPELLAARVLAQDMPRLFAEARRVLARRTAFSVYFRIRHSDGDIRWTHAQGRTVRDADGGLLRVVGVVRDARPDVEARESQVADPTGARHADMVQQLTTTLTQAATVEEVTEALVRAGLLGPATVKSVAICCEDHGHVLLLAFRGFPASVVRALRMSRLEDSLPLSETIRTGRPVFLDHAGLLDHYPQLRSLLPAHDSAGYAMLPLTAEGRTFGAVGLVSEGGGFSPQVRTLLLALSGTIAQSLQRALLYDRTREMAAGLQTSMLPAKLPQTPALTLAARYRPAPFAHEVGGDWYDALRLSRGRTALVIGDVQGHDVHAAAVMGQLRTALRAYLAEGHSAQAALSRAGRFLAELGTDRFATCTLAVLDPAAGEAEIVRAGHLGPLVRHADGRCAWYPVPGGMPLGPFPEEECPSTRIPFEAGATMVLCTDGLVESRTDDILVGKTALLRCLASAPAPLETLADHLLTAVADPAGNADDIALLLARRAR
ncbi:SpoIIE family protein phosphatase [Streptomyces sp. B3I8]|uniref:SpoIIE family protein phosphatase n=1 Tax=Streptomyces sp. B3I8 TaxID=3042303 RepID=UPI0027817E4D|nr:SpoIIE family protein phosphatase [Streptomyces sp. B3I8]MDQ0791181.1 PAS domain S-box-containing protein [Streptomyces sp. B3I8]